MQEVYQRMSTRPAAKIARRARLQGRQERDTGDVGMDGHHRYLPPTHKVRRLLCFWTSLCFSPSSSRRSGHRISRPSFLCSNDRCRRGAAGVVAPADHACRGRRAEEKRLRSRVALIRTSRSGSRGLSSRRMLGAVRGQKSLMTCRRSIASL